MTDETDIGKWIIGAATAALYAAAGWLWRTLMGLRDMARDNAAKIKHLEDEQVTKSDITDAISAAMEKAEEKADRRREQARRTYKLETKELVREALREAMNSSGHGPRESA